MILPGQKMLILENIPFPPSTNQLFAGQSRRYRSQKYKVWAQEFDLWAVKNMGALLGAKDSFRGVLRKDAKMFLSLTVDLNVPPSLIFTKDGRNKRIDATNYLKAMLDGLSDELDIDDSRFFLAKVEFVVYDIKDYRPNVSVMINTTRIRERTSGGKNGDNQPS